MKLLLYSGFLLATLVSIPVVLSRIPQSTGESAAVPSGVERYACEQATKMQLRDPDSYQLVEFLQVNDTQASLTFRARNGFGGYDAGHATCIVEGTGVHSVLL